jgi:hypothetical protein
MQHGIFLMNDSFSYDDENTPQKSWFSRNAKWAIPVFIGGVFCAICICTVAIFGIVFTAIGSSDAVTAAVEQAQQHEDVQAVLGTPIEKGWLITGSIETNNGNGTANITVPLSGPTGSGTLYANGRKVGGEDWFFDRLVFEPDVGSSINLLE